MVWYNAFLLIQIDTSIQRIYKNSVNFFSFFFLFRQNGAILCDTLSILLAPHFYRAQNDANDDGMEEIKRKNTQKSVVQYRYSTKNVIIKRMKREMKERMKIRVSRVSHCVW